MFLRGRIFRYVLGMLLVFASAGVLADADLQIKALDDTPDPALRGGRITYAVSIENNNVDVATNATLTFPLPATTQFESVDDTGCAHDGNSPGTVTCNFGDIGGNSTDIRNVEIVISTTAATGNTIDVTATVATTAVDSNSANDSNTQQTTINNGADLAITMADNPDPVLGGGYVTWTLSVVNQGPNDAVNVSVTNTLPPGVTYQSASGTDWNCSASGQTVTCTRPALANGAPAPDLQIVGKVTGVASGNITNSATVSATDASGNNMDPDLNNNTVTEDTLVNEGTDLAITKTVGTPVIGATETTFTLKPRNLGPNPAVNAVVTDTLPTGFAYVNATGPNWTCSQAGGTVTCTRASLPVGATDDITLSATAPATGGGTSNTASITSDTADPVTSNDSGAVTYTIVPDGADLALTKTKTPQPVAVDSDMTSIIKVHNNGPRATSGTITVTDTLHADETFVSATGTNWTCIGPGVGNTGTVTCTYGSQLNAGDDANDLTVVTQAQAAGSLENSASVADVNGEDDNVTGNETDTAAVTATAEKADLVVVKTVSDTGLDNTTPENSFTYTIDITNNGPDPATGIGFTDSIPGYYDGPAGTTGITVTTTPAGFSCSVSSGGEVTCTQNTSASLASSTTATFDIQVTRPIRDGALTNAVSAFSADVGDPDRTNNTDSVNLNVQPIADVEMQSVTVTPNPVPEGVEATFVLSFRNKGPSQAQNVVVTNVFSNDTDFTFISASPTEGSCSYDDAAHTLTCNGITLNNNESQSVTVKVRPNYTTANPSRTITSTATITTDTPQSDTTNDQAATDLEVDPSELDLLINKVDLTDPFGFDPTDRTNNIWTYDIQVTNQGPSLATGLVVTDTFTPKDGKTVKFLCDKTSGSVICDGDSPGSGNNAGYCDQQGAQVTGPGNLVITCTFPAGVTLAAGADLHHYLEFEVITAPDSGGDTHNDVAEVRANENESNSANNTEPEPTSVFKRVDLAITKTPSKATVEIGETFDWTVTVTNQGPGDSDTTAITDTLPSGMEVSGTPTWSSNNSQPASGNCTVAGSDITCDFGLLEAGKQAVVTIPARMTAFPTGSSIDNCATATTDQADPDKSNNETVCGTVQVLLSRVEGRVYLDQNGNGIFDAGDTPYANVDVIITASNGAVFTVTTDSNGEFGQDVPPGETTVDVDDSDPDLPGGVILTDNSQGNGEDASVVTVPSGGVARDETGYQLPPPGGTALVEGRVYEDSNVNGLFDTGEPVFSGIRVKITAANGAIYELVTSASGEFSQTVPPGDTIVDVTETDLPAGYILTSNTHGQGNDPTTVTVPAGGSARDDNGYRKAPQAIAIPALSPLGLALLVLMMTMLGLWQNARNPRGRQ